MSPSDVPLHGQSKVPCRVCRRPLVPLRDGTARRHGRWGDCPGSGYRLSLWPAGQKLAHYAGSVWEVVETQPNRYGGLDYVMRCLTDPHKTSGGRPGKLDTFHDEYLHRHGWRPVDA